jgi:acyl-coenzyme A thioesterase PaaI-like protein
MTFGGFVHDPTSTDEVDRRESVVAPLAQVVRELVDATIRTTVDDSEVDRVRTELEELVARLRASQLDGAAGVRFNSESRVWNWGNAVVGAHNAIAPPLHVTQDQSGRAHADVVLGAAYEGPPGKVHGGVAALLLDHIMGVTASGFRRITFTGTLTLRYERATPLGPLHLESWIAREDGRKIFVEATVSDAEGVTVAAEGIFIVPSWAV